LLLWALYLFYSGGDFMEFRLMVPVLPLMLILASWSIVDLLRYPGLRIVGVGLLVVASVVHGLTFERSPLRRQWIESVPRLQRWLDDPVYGWIGLGRFLGQRFDSSVSRDVPVRIALTPAGAIPFYSRLESIDMLGLNDRWIARHGADLSSRVGHRKIATLDYLVQRKVHLVLGHPQSLARPPPDDKVFSVEELHVLRLIPDAGSLPDGAQVVLVPYGRSAGILALYLTPHPAVDAVIERERWAVYPLSHVD
jgi:arabinofuranosyltransferase